MLASTSSPSTVQVNTKVQHKDDSCPICLLEYNSCERDVAPVVVVTRCGHIFDWDCLLQHFIDQPIGSRRCTVCQQNPMPVVTKDEQSKSGLEKRLTILSTNLMNLSFWLDGEDEDRAELYNFTEGCCFGLASSYVLYEKMGCPEEYDELLDTVSQDPELGWVFWNKHYADLIDAIFDAQRMFKNNPATQNHQTLFLLKLRPFCESLLAFQKPHKTILRKEVPNQNTEKTAQWIAQAADGDSPVLCSTPYYPIGLTEPGLCLLLNKLAETTSEGQGSRLFHILTISHVLTLKVTTEGFEIRDQICPDFKQFTARERGFVAAGIIVDNLHISHCIFNDVAIPRESMDIIFAIKEFTNVSPARNNSVHRSLETLLAEIPESNLLSLNHRDHKYNPLLLSLTFDQPSTMAETALAKVMETADRETDVVNQQNPIGWTALTMATILNYKNVVNKLLDQPGIRTNIPRRRGGAIPLHIACYHGHTEIVEKLLAMADVQINHKTNAGETPIQIAIKAGHIEVVKRLIEHGADIEWSLVALAPESCHGEIKELIETGLNR